MNNNNQLTESKVEIINDSPCTRNVYYLDLILIGHKLQIVDLFYYTSKNFLISTSIDYTIKYWDLKVSAYSC